MRTPIPDATVQLVLPASVQTATLRQKPTGRLWSAHTFVVPVGHPLTQSLSRQVRAIAPAARIGDRDDGKPARLTVTPREISVTFGVDDRNALAWGVAFGALSYGRDAIVQASATITADVERAGQSSTVTVTGESLEAKAFITVGMDDLGRAIGTAIDDAAAQLVTVIEQDLRAP